MTSNFDNLSLAASVASNALTVSLKTNAGSDPSLSNQTSIAFRNATLTDSTYISRYATSGLSITLSSGSTLGFDSNEFGRIYVWAIDNSGTIELALARKGNFSEASLVSTTAIGGGANSPDIMYSTTARSNVPARLLGYVELQTGSTAGNWSNAPTVVQIMGPGIYRTDEVIQVVSSASASSNTTTSGTDMDTGLSVSITPRQRTSRVLVTVHHSGILTTQASTGVSISLYRDSTSLLVIENVGSYYDVAASGNFGSAGVSGTTLDKPDSTSSVTYKTKFKRYSGSGTCYIQNNSPSATIVAMELSA